MRGQVMVHIIASRPCTTQGLDVRANKSEVWKSCEERDRDWLTVISVSACVGNLLLQGVTVDSPRHKQVTPLDLERRPFDLFRALSPLFVKETFLWMVISIRH
jgi:hypothetical protein